MRVISKRVRMTNRTGMDDALEEQMTEPDEVPISTGLPLAVRPMFRALGVGPSCSLLGGFAALAIPIPFVFIKYGARLRAKSKFTPKPGMMGRSEA